MGCFVRLTFFHRFSVRISWLVTFDVNGASLDLVFCILVPLLQRFLVDDCYVVGSLIGELDTLNILVICLSSLFVCLCIFASLWLDFFMFEHILSLNNIWVCLMRLSQRIWQCAECLILKGNVHIQILKYHLRVPHSGGRCIGEVIIGWQWSSTSAGVFWYFTRVFSKNFYSQTPSLDRIFIWFAI